MCYGQKSPNALNFLNISMNLEQLFNSNYRTIFPLKNSVNFKSDFCIKKLY